jgi:phosphoglycolate phosphatase
LLKPGPSLLTFDLDGTLVDSRLDLAESANELITAHGGRPIAVDALTGMVGEGARVLVARALRASGLAVPIDRALAEFLSIYDRRLVVHTRCYPGIERTIAGLEGRAMLAVLTNKPTHHTRRLLEHFGIGRFFRWTIGGDDRFPRKPDPAGLRFLIAEARTTAADTLYVGDSAVDVETARRAGVRICVAGYGFARFGRGLDLDGSELVADTPADLPHRLDQWLAERVRTDPGTNAT